MSALTTELLRREGSQVAPELVRPGRAAAGFFAQWLPVNLLRWLDPFRRMDFPTAIRLSRFGAAVGCYPFTVLARLKTAIARRTSNLPCFRLQLWERLVSIASVCPWTCGIQFTMTPAVNQFGDELSFVIPDRDWRNLATMPRSFS